MTQVPHSSCTARPYIYFTTCVFFISEYICHLHVTTGLNNGNQKHTLHGPTVDLNERYAVLISDTTCFPESILTHTRILFYTLHGSLHGLRKYVYFSAFNFSITKYVINRINNDNDNKLGVV